jgi:hypothetical protein
MMTEPLDDAPIVEDPARVERPRSRRLAQVVASEIAEPANMAEPVE